MDASSVQPGNVIKCNMPRNFDGNIYNHHGYPVHKPRGGSPIVFKVDAVDGDKVYGRRLEELDNVVKEELNFIYEETPDAKIPEREGPTFEIIA